MVKILLTICVMLGGAGLLWSCGPAIKPSYEVVKISMSGGQDVYFKREVGWRDHDVWVISPNSGLCKMPDQETDLPFSSDGPIDPLYKIDGDTLFLFVRGSAAHLPNKEGFPVNVVQKEVDPLDYTRMEKDMDKLGLRRLEVPIDASLRCPH
jgi:hypothetical protein